MSVSENYDCLVVLGPTASGKTRMAVDLAWQFGGEILSADSRMVYRQMDIGTGKDLKEYNREGKQVRVHLLNLVEPEEEYQLHRYQQDFKIAFTEIQTRGVLPVICGGSGLYLEAVLLDHNHTTIPVNLELRSELEKKTKEELQQIFLVCSDHPLKKTASTDTRKRLIRSLEMLHYLNQHTAFEWPESKPLKPFLIGLNPKLEQRRMNIEIRLDSRLREGLVEETGSLLSRGLTKEKIRRFGLEYFWTLQYLENKISFETMRGSLLIAIQQYAKRQMTWFRKMERSGFVIHWVNDYLEANTLVEQEFLSKRRI